MTSGGSESYTLSSDSGALYTIFPSSGNGPQTTHPYTQDGSPRSPSVPAHPGARLAGVHSPRSPHLHAGPSSTPRTLPMPMPSTTQAQARLPGVRQPPSLVPLEYLQSCSNTRNPTDQSMVEKLSVANQDPGRPSSSHGVNTGRVIPKNGFLAP